MTRVLLPVIAITIFVSFFRLGSVTLFDVDEAVFAEATKEMVQSGDLITPTYNGENRYDKPILFYWLMAASYKVFGINEFATRFSSALSGFILCLGLLFFLRQFTDEKMALYAVTSLAISIYFFAYSHAAVTDMTLTLFITLSLFSFYLSLEKDRRYVYGLYIFSALAFLTKGLIGILFPFGIATIYIVVKDGLKGIRKLFNLKAFVVFLIIALPWYIVQILINKDEFIQAFFIKHHFKRYTGVISGHKGPIFYYIPTLIVGLFPWIAFLPAGIKIVFKKNSELWNHNSKLNLFAFIWFAFILIFFSFSTTKLPNYILPAIPAASILIASGISQRDERWRRYSYGFIAVLSVLLGIAIIVSRVYLSKMGIHDLDWTILIAVIMLMMTVIALYAIFIKKIIYGPISFLMIAFLLVLSIKVLPLASQHLQGTLYKYSLYAKERLQGDERIITYGMNNPSIVFYSGHRIINVGDREQLSSLKNAGRLIIAKAKDIETLKDLGFNLIERDKGYAILERK
ncbi:MAG: ArnT family glycosyltransferase [Thermodesulfovibrionales bacterium]